VSAQKYSRKWKVHVIQHVHGMLGWARSYDEAQAFYDGEVRANLYQMDQTDGWRDEERHRFTLDAAWIVGQYLQRHPEEAERVRRRIQERRLEVSAYELSAPDLCFSGEELIRCFFRRAALERQGFARGELVVHSDVHSFSLAFPSVAAGCGARYLMVGTNSSDDVGMSARPENHRVPRGRALYWWQGPDGQRLLCFHYGDYFEARFLLQDNMLTRTRAVEDYLDTFEMKGDGYPYDRVVLFGTSGDGIAKAGYHHDLTVSSWIRDWNREHDAYDPNNNEPLLINGGLEGFFEEVEAHYGPQIPVFSGGWGGGDFLWDTQAQRFARAGLEARRSTARLHTAQALATAARVLTGAIYPRETLDRIWQYRLWHDEHDANGQLSLVGDSVRQEWREIQSQWGAQELAEPSTKVLEQAARAFQDLLPTQRSDDASRRLMVFNPVSQPRTDVACWPCPPPPEGRAWRVIHEATGNTVPSQHVHLEGVDSLLFLAAGVPSLGYDIYRLEEALPPPEGYATGSSEGSSIENDFHRVSANERGAIDSIWDKQLQREFVPFGAEFNRYYNDRVWSNAARVRIACRGPFATCLHCEATDLPSHTERLTTRVWLYSGLDRIDIVNRFEIAEAEQQVYFEFPVSLDGTPTFTLAGPAATIMTAGRDEFDESRLAHWNSFGFVDVSSAAHGLTLFSPDVRQAYLGGRFCESEVPTSDLAHASLLMRPIGHGPLGQEWTDKNGGQKDGPFIYRFGVATHGTPTNHTLALTEGLGVMAPFLVRPLMLGRRVPDGERRKSLWSVPSPLLVSAFKSAETGAAEECILRIWNSSPGSVAAAHITSDVFAVSKACLNDHLERDLSAPLTVKGGSFELDIPGSSMVTVRVWLSRKG
jgi:hypothetical protein